MSPEKKTKSAGSRPVERPARKSSHLAPETFPSDDLPAATETAEPVIKPEETFTFKATHFYAVLVVLAFAVGVLIGYVAWGRAPASAAQAAVAAEPPAAAAAAPQFKRYNIPTDGFPSLGPANAPITLVEFADFQCPYCRQWEQQTYRPLLQAYPGKIRMVYRDLPLTSIHPNAMPAAEAAQCANEQGKFWEYHDKLFDGEDLSDALYKQYAQELGLDMTRFNECVSTHKYAEAIQADSDFAVKLGVNSTPTFFINGLAVIGAQPLESFTGIIDKELAGQIPK